jgi:Protein of unknown function (DUF3626)/Probable Zinc-ribbon domain
MHRRTIQELSLFWDEDKNGGSIPMDLPLGSAKKCHWIHKNTCGCIHRWTTSIANMSTKRKSAEYIGCAICSGKFADKAKPCCENMTNSLLGNEHFHNIKHEWSSDNVISPSDLYYSSSMNVKWQHLNEKCGCLHVWVASINNRVRQKKACPICAHQKPPCCNKESVEACDKLMMFWDHEKNKSVGIFPKDFTVGSRQVVHWLCKNTCQGQPDCKHEWKCSINKCSKNGCPHEQVTNSKNIYPCCTNRSLASKTYIEITEQLHPDSRQELGDLRNFYPSTIQPVKWICKSIFCECVHEWVTPLYARVRIGCSAPQTGCPVCSNPPKSICCRKHPRSLYNLEDKRKLEMVVNSCSKRRIDIEGLSMGCKDKIEIDCIDCDQTFNIAICNISLGNWCCHCNLTNSSKVSCNFLDCYARTFDVQVIHKHFNTNISSKCTTGQEHQVKIGEKLFKVDGYVEKTKTVIEFHGDFWHGNPQKFHPLDLNKINKRPFGDLYTKTFKRMFELGTEHNIEYVWEDEFKHWKKQKGVNKPLLPLNKLDLTSIQCKFLVWIREQAKSQSQTFDHQLKHSDVISNFLRYNSQVIIHVKEHMLDTILKDGYYRNQFETKTSGGSRDLESRKKWEDSLFSNYYHDVKDEERCKYGCLNVFNDNEGVKSIASQYGSAFFELKEEVKERSTFCFGDSGDKLQVYGTIEVALGTFEAHLHILYAMTSKDIQNILQFIEADIKNDLSQFIEVQIHGNILVQRDIKYLHFPSCRRLEYQTVLETYEKNNIKVKFF